MKDEKHNIGFFFIVIQLPKIYRQLIAHLCIYIYVDMYPPWFSFLCLCSCINIQMANVIRNEYEKREASKADKTKKRTFVFFWVFWGFFLFLFFLLLFFLASAYNICFFHSRNFPQRLINICHNAFYSQNKNPFSIQTSSQILTINN